VAYPTSHVADNPTKRIDYHTHHLELLHVLARKKRSVLTFSWDGCSVLSDALGLLRHVCDLLFARSKLRAAHVSDDGLAIAAQVSRCHFEATALGNSLSDQPQHKQHKYRHMLALFTAQTITTSSHLLIFLVYSSSWPTDSQPTTTSRPRSSPS
jgi:hypothetical protein